MEYTRKYYETNNINVGQRPEMNVMMFSSQEQFDYTYAVLLSLMENNPSVMLHLFIASFVEIEGREELIKFIEGRGNRITFYCVDIGLVECFQKGEVKTRAGLGGFLRPTAHLFVEEKYDRMLFLDADMVVLGDIYTDFYNLDFEDKFLIAAANPLDYQKLNSDPEKNITYNTAVRGSYFNTGLLVLNLKKLRACMPYDKVIETFNSEKAIKHEQHLLNALCAQCTRYVSVEIYNNRWVFLLANNNITEKYLNNIRLFHYDSTYAPFKPWDIWFEDKSQLEKIKPAPYKGISSKFRQYIINSYVNDMIGLWWKYCKKTPVYEKLYNRMSEVRTYFSTYIINMINAYNSHVNTLEELYVNISADETDSIKAIQKKNKLTYLNAINEYYDLPQYDYSEADVDIEITNLDRYLESLCGNKDLVVFITCCRTAHHIARRLTVKNKLGLKMECRTDQSYLAVIDFSKNKVIERSGDNIIVQKYSIVLADSNSISITYGNITSQIVCEKSVSVMLKSQGINAKTLRSYNSILIDNVEYAQGICGLNIVVYSRSKNAVVDTCYADDAKLEVKR